MIQTDHIAKPQKPVGVGLRAPHFGYFCEQKPDTGWLEIHSENFFRVDGAPRETLRHLRSHYAISCHGVGLSLGSVDPVNRQHLNSLVSLVNEIEPFLVSDHLSWSSVDGQYFNDLLPLPYTEEALEVFCRNVLEVQDALKRPILVENPSSYLSYSHSTINEWDFLVEVQKRTDCGLLLDLNNIYVSAFNHGFDAQEYLAAIDPATVGEIHLAGFTVKQLPQGEVWIDTHSMPVTDGVWALYRQWLETHAAAHNVPPTLIEWDRDLPEPQVLLTEADKAKAIIRETCAVTEGDAA
ncbi:DUF692 domain-containing protein [Parasalinivibrio latis]|uniref:MNIO family bufferin maturase n=1 Tax=Parasalinivibrio latis TaxID=2952610 RepID=UPI0030E56A24